MKPRRVRIVIEMDTVVSNAKLQIGAFRLVNNGWSFLNAEKLHSVTVKPVKERKP